MYPYMVTAEYGSIHHGGRMFTMDSGPLESLDLAIKFRNILQLRHKPDDYFTVKFEILTMIHGLWEPI